MISDRPTHPPPGFHRGAFGALHSGFQDTNGVAVVPISTRRDGGYLEDEGEEGEMEERQAPDHRDANERAVEDGAPRPPDKMSGPSGRVLEPSWRPLRRSRAVLEVSGAVLGLSWDRPGTPYPVHSPQPHRPVLRALWLLGRSNSGGPEAGLYWFVL